MTRTLRRRDFLVGSAALAGAAAAGSFIGVEVAAQAPTIRILDFRNRPPLPAYAQLFDIKHDLLLNSVKRGETELWFSQMTKSPTPGHNRGAAAASPSMNLVGRDDALPTWVA